MHQNLSHNSWELNITNDKLSDQEKYKVWSLVPASGMLQQPVRFKNRQDDLSFWWSV